MTVAFSDVNLVCDMLRPLPSFANFVATNHATADFYVARKPLSATINTLANALYKVRCAGPGGGGGGAGRLRARAPHMPRGGWVYG